MLFCIFLLNINIYLVPFVEALENSLSLSVDPDVDVYRVFHSENRSIFEDELNQKFVIFNSKNERKVIARFGDFKASTTTKPMSLVRSVKLHTDRQAFLVPTESNTIKINTLCEFVYSKSDMSSLENIFYCTVELHLNNKLQSNPTSSCRMRLDLQSSECFTPLELNNTLDLPPISILTATVHPFESMQTSVPNYATSPPVYVSFSNHPPLIWQLADYNETKLLLGLPIHSSRLGENILIGLRMTSVQAPAASQLIRIQCIIDSRITIIAIIPNSPIVTMLKNESFYNSTHFVQNIEFHMKPGRDRELFAFNATLTSDSAANGAESFAPTLQCCFKQSLQFKQRKVDCGRAQIVTLSVEINSMIIIPALKTPGNKFSIYNTPKVSLLKEQVDVYGVVNYRDRSVRLVNEQVTVSVMDHGLVNVSGDVRVANIDMQYQTVVNPWSIQLSMYSSKYTVLSPVKMWRAEAWRMVLSEQSLKPIKNWLVPKPGADGTTCERRYRVARLKILCSLYTLDESGIKHYVGSDTSSVDNIPFIDVTDSTSISQFRVIPPNIVILEKSPDNGHFLVTANQIGQSASIELLSQESSSQIITSARVSVDADFDNLYIVDLIVHCVDALSLDRRNTSASAIRAPYEYEFISVSMSMDTQTLPCYLLVFLVFNDRSVERVSSFEQTHYQMFLVNSNPRSVSSSAITDGQLVSVKWSNNANISVYESSACAKPKLIFSKKMNWEAIVPLSDLYAATNAPLTSNAQVTSNQRNWRLYNNTVATPNNILQTSLYISFSILVFLFLCLILYKIRCLRKSRSRNQGTAPTCYNISDSCYLNDHSKLQIRHSNSKNFSSLGKYSSNCIKNPSNKTHINEPYPPLLPPPGPITPNYDMTLHDPICCDSAVDSGIELGKLSNYSSNTNPSNDLCCSIDQHLAASIGDDNPPSYRQPPPPYVKPLFGYYPHKEIMDSIHAYDNVKMKTISNLRPPQW